MTSGCLFKDCANSSSLDKPDKSEPQSFNQSLVNFRTSNTPYNMLTQQNVNANMCELDYKAIMTLTIKIKTVTLA